MSIKNRIFPCWIGWASPSWGIYLFQLNKQISPIATLVNKTHIALINSQFQPSNKSFI